MRRTRRRRKRRKTRSKKRKRSRRGGVGPLPARRARDPQTGSWHGAPSDSDDITALFDKVGELIEVVNRCHPNECRDAQAEMVVAEPVNQGVRPLPVPPGVREARREIATKMRARGASEDRVARVAKLAAPGRARALAARTIGAANDGGGGGGGGGGAAAGHRGTTVARILEIRATEAPSHQLRGLLREEAGLHRQPATTDEPILIGDDPEVDVIDEEGEWRAASITGGPWEDRLHPYDTGYEVTYDDDDGLDGDGDRLGVPRARIRRRFDRTQQDREDREAGGIRTGTIVQPAAGLAFVEERWQIAQQAMRDQLRLLARRRVDAGLPGPPGRRPAGEELTILRFMREHYDWNRWMVDVPPDGRVGPVPPRAVPRTMELYNIAWRRLRGFERIRGALAFRANGAAARNLEREVRAAVGPPREPPRYVDD